MQLPDPESSRVLLIGTSAYLDGELPAIPGVRNNVEDLRAMFTDPVYGIVPDHNCNVLLDQSDISLVGLEIRRAARQAEGLLLVYFAGHGLTAGRRHELYLALHGTDSSEPEFTALEYDKLRSAVLDSPASTKIIILDCCFSGRALSGMMADPARALVSQADVKGTYVLTSAYDYGVSLALEGEDHTAFTGRLLGLMRQGVHSGAEYLTIDSLYWHLKTIMESEGLPQPQRRGGDGADRLAIAVNRRYDPAITYAPPLPSAGLSLNESMVSESDSAYKAPSLPPTARSWRESVKRYRSPNFVPSKPDWFNYVFWRFFGIVTGPCWLVLNAWLALDYRPAWLSIAVSVTGVASAIGWYLERKSTARRVMRTLGWATIALYVTYEFLADGGFPVRLWMLLSVFLFTLWIFSIEAWVDKRREYRRDLPLWESRSPIVTLVERGRWITGSNGEAETLVLSHELEALPAVRFVSLPGIPLSFLAVAGKRLLFVTQLTLPVDDIYSVLNIMSDTEFSEGIARTAAEAARWSTLLGSANILETLVVAVVRPREPGLASNTLKIRVRQIGDVRLVTPPAFGDLAGEFLLEGAYDLDLGLLSLICTQLGLIASPDLA